MLNGHGSEAYLYKNIKADFSSNVWYEGISKQLETHLTKRLSSLLHYPSPDAVELSKAIGNIHQISPKCVLATNGATEAFYLLAQLYQAAKSLVFYPSFAEYADACKLYKHSIKYEKNSEIYQTEFGGYDIAWIGNPNNPDGYILSTNTIEQLVSNYENCIFIIDEAYVELFEGVKSVIHLTAEYSNLIVVRSLTKTFAIPGIRLGYIVANATTIERLLEIKMPWSVNALAIEAGKFIADNYQQLLPSIEKIISETAFLQHQLAKIPEVTVFFSTGNYFLLKLKKGKAAKLKKYLIKHHQFLIRDASNFKGLDTAYFRLSIQQKQYNEELVAAIKKYTSR